MNKILKLFPFLIILILCLSSNAQNNMEDIVYLKDGKTIRGMIIEQIPNQSLKLQTNDKTVSFYKFDEIEKIEKGNTLNNRKDSTEESGFKKNGFINLTEINLCAENVGYSFGLRTINGYQFNENISLGVGVGADGWIVKVSSKNHPKIVIIPITLDMLVSGKGKISPIFRFNTGYSLGVNGGLIINAALGLKKYISKNTAYIISIGYKWQSLSNVYYYENNKFVYLLSINTGILF